MRFHRRVIKIRGQDSPNVRLGLAQEERGLVPTDEEVVPGVLSYREYLKRLATWDAIRICIGIHAEFYEGAEVLLYPPDWIDRAHAIARTLPGGRKAEAIGIDPAEGGDQTTMAAVDGLGLIELVSAKTPDTAVITEQALRFMAKHQCPASKVVFDRGGGGKQHADYLRNLGHKVVTVGFGEGLTPDPRRGQGFLRLEDRLDLKEERFAYVNRRAQLYGDLRNELLDPTWNPKGWGVPEHYELLRKEMAPIPLLYDREGRMRMLPKHHQGNEDEATLVKLIGHSPDQLDAVVLAVHGMLRVKRRAVAGAAG